MIDHVRRVAAAVSRDARVVAWLHEMFEHTSISEEALLAEGVSTDELRALKLLTRDQESRSNTSYLAHVQLIADAKGEGARIARSVKRADLADRARHRWTRADGWSPPYELGLAILQRSASPRASPLSLGLPTSEPEFRAERLGMALRGLAAELVNERRKVARLRREVAELQSQLASDVRTQRVDDAAIWQREQHADHSRRAATLRIACWRPVSGHACEHRPDGTRLRPRPEVHHHCRCPKSK